MDSSSLSALVLENKFLPRIIKDLILISGSWAFHIILGYEERTEQAFAIILEIITFLVLSVATVRLTDFYTGLLLAFIIAHTIHWFFNGHIFQLFSNLGFTKIDRKIFIEYSMAIQQRVVKQESLLAVAIFGSLSRDELTESSDLDVRMIRQSGLINAIKAYTFTFLERARAFLQGFPLDIYVLDGLKSLSKLRPEEMPIILHDPEKTLTEWYPCFSLLNEIIGLNQE